MRERLRWGNGRPRASALLLPVMLLTLKATPLRGQDAAFGGAGGPSMAADFVPLSRTIPEREAVQSEMTRARLRLGPMRILPSFSVWNAGYDSNVFGTTEDPVAAWTFSVNAGARFLIPMGSKFVLRADAFPQYTWYSTLADRNRFGGNYNGSLYAFFNRMTVEFLGGYFQQYQEYSSEVDTRVLQTSTAGSAKIDVDLTSRLSLFGQGGYQNTKYEQLDGPPPQEVGVPRNNRVGTGGRGGLRYAFSDDFNVGFAAEATFSDFEFTPELRNNRSNAYLASVGYNTNRFYLNLLGGYREGVGEDNDSFPRYSTGVGSFFLSFFPISWLELQAYGHRDISYSITVFNPYYFENRLGGKVNIQVGPRILLSGYGQAGPNNYPESQPVDVDGEIELVKRRDEAEQYGGGFSVIVYRPIVVTGRVVRTSFDSNIPGNDRSYIRYTFMLSFSGTFER